MIILVCKIRHASYILLMNYCPSLLAFEVHWNFQWTSFVYHYFKLGWSFSTFYDTYPCPLVLWAPTMIFLSYCTSYEFKSSMFFVWVGCYYTFRTTKLLGGILVSLRPSVRPSVRLSRLPCPLCNIYSSKWFLSILATNDHYHERVCHTQGPLTLTLFFKVIRPWLRKSCPLCSVYSSGWILFIFGTNDYYQ